MNENQVNIDPSQILQLSGGFMGSAALKAGLELEIFTHIAQDNNTAMGLAAATGTTERAIRILCDALLSFGLLNKSDGRYSLPPASALLLVKNSTAYIGDFARVTINPMLWEHAGKLTDIVRAGHSLMLEGAETHDHPFWHEFSRSSHRAAAAVAPHVVELAARMMGERTPEKILDIACGSGIYGFTALKRFKDARLTSADWPGVLELAEPVAADMGVCDRVQFRPGNIFAEDLGAGHDLVFAVNIFHHFSIAKNIELSHRLHDATAPGGMLVIVDFIPDDRREHPGFALIFALTMLIWTQNGDSYTLEQYKQMLTPAGFKDVALEQLHGAVAAQAIVARK